MKKTLILIAGLAVLPAFGQEEIMPRPPKRPWVGGNELVRLIRDTRIGEPHHAKNLVVYPLFTSGRASDGYWTLDQALARRVLRITEKGEGNVPELLVENLAGEPIFLMAGEIVTGGKQNRVIAQDILLAPHSGPISLGVYCVEHGRWTAQTRYFGAEKEIAHNQLRQQLNDASNSQGRVWAEVARKASAVAAPAAASPTGYLGAALGDRDVKRKVDEYTRPISLPREANGMAVLTGGRVAGVEIFGDCETFAKLRDKLLRSYAVDAIESYGTDLGGRGRDVVVEFLRRAEDTRLVSKPSLGLGRLLGIEGAGLYGSVLVFHEQRGAHGVVHASIFPSSPLIEQPTPRPHPRRWPRE
ncbi:MAG: hypothetical protein FJ388_12215 [Verrucomicrobia bacterium]|nr:hypothetical protein [Verrucomicrobiota bacterium]